MFINPNYFSFSGLLVNMIKWSKNFNSLWKGIAWEQEDWGEEAKEHRLDNAFISGRPTLKPVIISLT